MDTPGKKNYGDDRFWKITRDSNGNGSAIIRFLPTPEFMEDPTNVPYVWYWSHGFQGPTGQWYIENSLTTVDKEDPMAEYNSKLWATGVEANKDLARKYKRLLNYVANVYIVKDPSNPENEGKVFLFRYGQSIADIIKNAMVPGDVDVDEDLGEEPPKEINAFDIFEGAALKLVVKNKANFPNYENSKFMSTTALAKTEKEMEEIVNRAYSLQEFTDPDGGFFKSYDQLLARRNKVLGLDETTHSPEPSAEVLEDDDDDDFDKMMENLALETEEEMA